MKRAKYWIEKLKLQKHPEGGYFKEIYRNNLLVDLPDYNGPRNVATSIYYLLEKVDRSHFHRLKSDELWYYHSGDALTICIFDKKGVYYEKILGNNPEKNEELQVIIPTGSIFGAYIKEPGQYTLMGCMVNPGFDFKDFEMIDRNYLIEKYPDHKTIIELLSK